MKKTVWAALVVVVALGSAAWADDLPGQDGYTWLALSRSQKTWLVTGALLMSEGIDSLRECMDWDTDGTTLGTEMTVGRIVDEIDAAFARGCQKDTSLSFVLVVYFVEQLRNARWQMLRPERQDKEGQAPGSKAS